MRDPEGVYGDPDLTAAFDPDASLPAGAVDSGYRQGPTELWTVPADLRVIYLKNGDAAERWPRGETPVCA